MAGLIVIKVLGSVLELLQHLLVFRVVRVVCETSDPLSFVLVRTVILQQSVIFLRFLDLTPVVESDELKTEDVQGAALCKHGHVHFFRTGDSSWI